MFTTTSGGDTLTTVSGFGSTTGQDRCHRQLISQRMPAGITFSAADTYKCYVQCLESAANDNMRSRMGVRILSEDGSTVRHTILAVADYSTAAEWNTALRNKAFANGDAGAGSYTTVAGDRLVVEIGHNDVAGSTISGSSRWGSAGTADLGENETSTSTTERPWFETSENITFLSDPTNVNVGQASETDSALAITGRKNVAVGIASETESALDVTLGAGGPTEVDVLQATETDSALAITARKNRAVGLASEADSAQAVTARKNASVGLASETDSALTIDERKRVAAGLASEADSAQAVTSRKNAAVGLTTETDSALSITAGGAQEIDVGLTTETDSALTLAVRKLIAVGLASEADSAFTVTSRKNAAVGMASESDTALPIGSGGVAIDAGLGIETDTALAVGRRKRVHLGI